MSDFLSRMAEASRARVLAAKTRVGEGTLLSRASARPVPPPLHLGAQSFDVIAEFKARGPGGEVFVADARDGAKERAAAYLRGGACAVSVLTEPEAFGGSLDDLAAIAGASPRPTMRKDFLVDPYQVLEAKAAGASGVLLVARLLQGAALGETTEAAADAGLFVVVEAFDDGDFPRAVAAVIGARGPAFLGVNARDLRTLEVDPGRHAVWARRIPPGCRAIAESGVSDARDTARLARSGYRAALVGSVLMRSTDPAALLAAMISAGRTAASHGEVVR